MSMSSSRRLHHEGAEEPGKFLRDPGGARADRGSTASPRSSWRFEAEIDLTCVGGIERGKRNPSLLVMGRVADALKVPLLKLLAD